MPASPGFWYRRGSCYQYQVRKILFPEPHHTVRTVPAQHTYPLQPRMSPGAWHVPAVPALKGRTDAARSKGAMRRLLSLRGRAAATGLRRLLAVGRATPREETWLAPGRTATTELCHSRAAPPTPQGRGTAQPRAATCRPLAPRLPGQALALRRGKAALAAEPELCSSLTSATGCGRANLGEAYTAAEGGWMPDKVTRRGTWPTANELHMFR